MATRLSDRAIAVATTTPRLPPVPDRGHEALASLVQLRDQLVQALSARGPRRWKEPPAFFFDRRRQAAYEAARAAAPVDSFADLAAAIDAADAYAGQ